MHVHFPKEILKYLLTQANVVRLRARGTLSGNTSAVVI